MNAQYYSSIEVNVEPTNTHKGVREQFYVAVAAIQSYESLKFGYNQLLSKSLRTHHKKIIKTVIKKYLSIHCNKTGFLITGLAYYAYEFWEIIVESELGVEPSHKQVIAFSKENIQNLANFLDNQFAREGLADSISFFKSLMQQTLEGPDP